MAFDEELAPGWLHELPFYTAATVAYGVLFTLNPTIQWGSRERAPDPAVPIQFVAALPAASPNLAPAPGGDDRAQRPPRRGPGAFVPAKVTARAAPKSVPKKIHKAQPRPQRAVRKPARKALPNLAALAAARARAARIAAERQARLAAARKKAELTQTLAAMDGSDETLGQEISGDRTLAGKSRADRSSEKVSAAAALSDDGSAVDADGSDPLDLPAKGGGEGPDGSGVAYTLDGPVGSRRVLERPVPSTPDWVGERGLDLRVVIRFRVLPDGSVKPGAVILKTSGFPEIDRRALDALSRWRFETVPPHSAEVWGRVAFRFTS